MSTGLSSVLSVPSTDWVVPRLLDAWWTSLSFLIVISKTPTRLTIVAVFSVELRSASYSHSVACPRNCSTRVTLTLCP